MTVCIGVLCKHGDDPAVVVAADRMVTYGPPMNLQTEPSLTKILPMTDRCVFLFSGPSFDGEEIARRVRTQISGSKHTIRQISDRVLAAYREFKQKRAEDTIIAPLLGTDFATFRTMAAQSPASQVLNQIMMLLSQHNLNLEILIAGLDQTGPHVDLVTHPGTLMNVGQTGFAAVGVGALHASVWLSLGAQTSNSDLADTAYNVYEAKKASEVAPGVGELTDMAIIHKNGIRSFDAAMFDKLEKAHKAKPILSAAEKSEIQGVLNDYVSKQQANP